jgi:hypothetical protein
MEIYGNGDMEIMDMDMRRLVSLLYKEEVW